MSAEVERAETRKAMAFDLCRIVDENPKQVSYTPEEVKKLITVYVTTSTQQ